MSKLSFFETWCKDNLQINIFWDKFKKGNAMRKNMETLLEVTILFTRYRYVRVAKSSLKYP